MRLLLILLAFSFVGCTSVEHLSDSQEFWYASKEPLYYGVFYCSVNKSSTTGPHPVCVEAVIIKNH